MHTNQNYVFNIDLKDFFPSIDIKRVWNRLQRAPFNFNAKVAYTIAGLCTMRTIHYREDLPFEEAFVLPQGAPTSPLLTKMPFATPSTVVFMDLPNASDCIIHGMPMI